MTQSETSDSRRAYYELIEKLRERRRVDLAPEQRCWDITTCCGPAGNMVMVNTYADRGSAFLTPDEARAIASAIERAARFTDEHAHEASAVLEADWKGAL